jgi:hypothetical protein
VGGAGVSVTLECHSASSALYGGTAKGAIVLKLWSGLELLSELSASLLEYSSVSKQLVSEHSSVSKRLVLEESSVSKWSTCWNSFWCVSGRC